MEGRCSCGAVRFRCDGPLVYFGHCHCSMCRKHHGASFVTWIGVRSSSFAWTSGEDQLGVYGSSEHVDRQWCRRCGSTVPTVHGESGFSAGVVDVPAGSLVTPLEERPTYHLFAASKAPWVEIDDGLTVHDGWREPDRSPPEVQGPARATRPGCVTGSCLCGEVVFEVETPVASGTSGAATSDAATFDGMRNCHCRRCRLARGAAHATNLFAPPARVRFVRGAERVVDYALPEAERFGVAFCGGCGSHVARVVAGRPYAVIPAGALDQDPGIRPSGHIFVGSKAEWFDIADDLPRYDEYQPAG